MTGVRIAVGLLALALNSVHSSPQEGGSGSIRVRVTEFGSGETIHRKVDVLTLTRNGVTLLNPTPDGDFWLELMPGPYPVIAVSEWPYCYQWPPCGLAGNGHSS